MTNINPWDELIYMARDLTLDLKEENLKENDMLLSQLAQARDKAKQRRVLFTDEDFKQIMDELDAAEAEILRIRSEI